MDANRYISAQTSIAWSIRGFGTREQLAKNSSMAGFTLSAVAS